jgi:hypothetical protein
MSQSMPERPANGQPAPRTGPTFVGTTRGPGSQSLADVGDIQVRLLDIELLTIKVRLMIASVDRAREMGINWWEGDPFVSSLAEQEPDEDRQALERRIEELEQRLAGREQDERA